MHDPPLMFTIHSRVPKDHHAGQVFIVMDDSLRQKVDASPNFYNVTVFDLHFDSNGYSANISDSYPHVNTFEVTGNALILIFSQ